MAPVTVASRADRINRTLEHLRDGSTDRGEDVVPFGPAQYTDPATAARERDLVFGRVPSIVAHSSELPQPYDFITRTMPRNRVSTAVRASPSRCRSSRCSSTHTSRRDSAASARRLVISSSDRLSAASIAASATSIPLIMAPASKACLFR